MQKWKKFLLWWCAIGAICGLLDFCRSNFRINTRVINYFVNALAHWLSDLVASSRAGGKSTPSKKWFRRVRDFVDHLVSYAVVFAKGRAVECPSDVIDQIAGWLTQGVGASYGLGHNHGTLTRWLVPIVEVPNLES